MTDYSLFATTPKAMEGLLAEEIAGFGGQQIQPTLAGVAFRGDLATAYRACLWSRTASRILLRLATFQVNSQQDLYDGVYATDWAEHLAANGSLAVTFSAKNSKVITHTHFGALKVKDAVVDQLRDRFQQRPNIDTDKPDLRVHVYLHGNNAQLSLDLSGESLHRRGYRDVTIAAPIKENLAAAMLLRSDWSTIATAGGSLLDPMCGSGTLLLEAALLAADFAPGLLRDYFGFLGWKQHDAETWRQLRLEARQRREEGMQRLPLIVGFDQNRHSVAAALKHIENAGLQHKIYVEKRDISLAAAADSWPKGLLVCNPPYGERLGDEAQTAELYRQFGEILKQRFVGWRAAMILSNPELGFRIGIRSQKPVTLFNGALECKLLRFAIDEQAFFTPKAKTPHDRLQQLWRDSAGARAEMFANRLQKNLHKRRKWARRQHITCYRLYDADLPEYNVAVDLYQGEKTWVNVQEYEAPGTVDEFKANARLAGVLAEIPRVLKLDSRQVFLKIRRKQKNTLQYEKHGDRGRFHVIEEAGCKLLVNFEDYLDTGLFLDHRPLRLLLQQQAAGKRFLNLFAYTASATVHAAVGGAVSSTSVDMSNTYLDWAQHNFRLNHMSNVHRLVRADCLEWLQTQSQASAASRLQFDLIFLDPPTFSNSKKMDDTFAIQADHVQLIEGAAALLAPGGTLYFSTNFRRFKIDVEQLSGLSIKNISFATIPEDFARNPKIHACWRIQHE